MTNNAKTYTVAYNDEKGNSAERTYTNREEAVIAFHETAGIDFAGFPQEDADAFEHQGWLTETAELRGITHIAEYDPERGNWNVTLYIIVEWLPETPEKPEPVRMKGADIRPGMSLLNRDGQEAYIVKMTPGPNAFVTRAHFNMNGQYRTGLLYAKTEYTVACVHGDMRDVPGLSGVKVCMSCNLKVIDKPGT